MRHPGDSAVSQPPGQGSGRHRDSARRDAPGRRAQPAARGDGGQPDNDSAVFGPGYRGPRPGGGGHARPGPGLGPAADGTLGKGPVRGFPPAPGQPAPLYPPGQFAAWNRMSAARAAAGPAAGPRGRGAAPGAGDQARGIPAGGHGDGGYGDEVYEPDYSALAVSDPAADVTSTQTWSVISDNPDSPGAWTSPRGSEALTAAAAGRPAAAQPTLAADPVTTAADAAGAAAEAAGAAGPAGSRAAGSRVASRAAARGGRARRTGRPASAVLAVCAVLVAAVAAGAFLLHAAEHQAAPSTADRSAAAPSTAAASPSPTLGFGHIASRTADPLPLTVAQLFPSAFTVDGVAFSRTTSEPKGTCSSAVIGTALQAAVPARTCTQVVRASYLAPAEKAMGTIGVLNLSTAATATHAGHAADTADFIAQLKGLSGPTRALGQGAGLEEAATKGHYLILIWAQFVNSASPKSPAQQAQLKNFMTQLFDETANVSLSNRMVSGTP
jgi:hypothetical protein